MSAQGKHTPGPWSNCPMQPTVWAKDGEVKIATVADLPWVENPVTGRRSSDTATEEANARLIALSPEMFDKLTECAQSVGVWSNYLPDGARAAANRLQGEILDLISKAVGGAS